MNVANLLRNTAERLPEKTAVVFQGQNISYGQLMEQILRAANGLKQAGIEKDSNVALMMINSPQYIISYYALLAVGATVVPINPTFKEKELIYVLNDAQCKAILYDFVGAEVVETMFTMFVHSPKLKEYDYSSLRIFGSGGASIPVEIIDRIRKDIGVEILEAYGQTEATIMITSQPVDGEKVVGSVGPPIEGVELRIVTADDRDVPQGEVGEIIFRGRNVMKGYYGKPEETAATIRDGWAYTGDLGYQDKQGNVFIVDRKKDMIIRGGYNVYPREIEEVLYSHPDVVECAVIGEPDDVFGEEIVAYVVGKNELEEQALSDYCRERIVGYKTPRIYRFIDSLPKTATGKILKGPLRQKHTTKR